jgi:hypothetical protein
VSDNVKAVLILVVILLVLGIVGRMELDVIQAGG